MKPIRPREMLQAMWPVSVLATAPVVYIALVGDVPRVDRLTLLLLLSSCYLALGGLAIGVLAAASRILVRLDPARPMQLPARDLVVAGMSLFLGLFAANHLVILFGYKDAVLAVLPIWASLPPLVEIAVLLGAVGIPPLAYLRSHWVRKRWLWTARWGIWPWILGPVVVLAPPVRSLEAPTPWDGPSSLDVTRRNPVIVLALDGLDRRLLEKTLEKGDLSNFTRVMRSGVADLGNQGFGFSPIVWNAVITGLPPEVHGISDFVRRESLLFSKPLDSWWPAIPPGFGIKAMFEIGQARHLCSSRLIDGRDRRSPSIWQVLSTAGYKSLTVNFVQSFPAEIVNGVFVAWRAPTKVIRLAQAGDPTAEGLVYPPNLPADLKSFLQSRHESEARPLEAELQALMDVTLAALQLDTYDLITVYSDWPDAFGHTFTLAEFDAAAQGDFNSGRPAAYLRFLRMTDRFIGALLAAVPDANLLVISDHGVRDGYRFKERVVQHLINSPGVFMAFGPDAGDWGSDSSSMCMYDIFPSLLGYWGLPLARDLEGIPDRRVLSQLPQPKPIASYRGIVPNRRLSSHAVEPPADILNRLRALGYVQ